MTRLAVLVVVVCALIIGLMPTASADAWVRWKDQATPNYMEVVEVENADPWSLEGYVWQFGSDFGSPGLLLDDSSVAYHDADFPQRYRVVGGGTGDWQNGDLAIPIYVRLVTKFKNVGTEDWTDFHLRAISGCVIYPKYVMDNGLWNRLWDYSGDGSGWDYIMNPDYAQYPGFDPVSTGDYFACETWIAVTDPSGNFEVELLPTAVPEPSALAALGGGLMTLLAAMRRRTTGR